MAATEKNGQASMEEILASIRRIIAEDPAEPAPLIDLSRRPNDRPAGQGAEDGADFDLPSMFRHRKPTLVQGRQPLYGRLTDALRQAAPARGKDAATAEGAPGKVNDVAVSSAEAFGRAQPDPANAAAGAGLSELKPRQQPLATNGQPSVTAVQPNSSAPGTVSNAQAPNGQPSNAAARGPQVGNSQAPIAQAGAATVSPAPVTSEPSPASPNAASASASDVAPPRVMAPFRDTRMVRMAPGTAPAKPVPAASPQSQTAAATTAAESQPPLAAAQKPENNNPGAVDFSTIVPLQMGLPGRQPQAEAPAQGPRPSGAAAGPDPVSAQHMSQATVVQPDEGPEPPPLPDADRRAEPEGRIEDATADLLRPMLRQWLSENMPRMVEKALHIEVAESVQLSKKPNAS